MDMILGRKDFDPNVVTEEKQTTSGVIFPRTVITAVFGYKAKDEITTPEQGWKKRLLNDSRVNWGFHDSLIVQAHKQNAIANQKHEEHAQRTQETKRIKVQVAPIKKALGLY